MAVVTVLGALCLLVVGVTASARALARNESITSNGFDAVPVHIYQSQYTGAFVVNEVLRQLLEEHFPQVNVSVHDFPAIYDAVQQIYKDPDTIGVVPEVWPSSVIEYYQSYLRLNAIENLGELGVVGRIGWYVPDYLLEDYPDADQWQFYQLQSTAELFATSSTAPNGRFLGGSPYWDSLDKQIIKNLGLPFTVEYAGNESALVGALHDAVQNRQPILMYWWVPTAVAGQYGLVKVNLPPITEHCKFVYAKSSDLYDCDYPEDITFKVASPGLKDQLPDVYELIKALTITNEDQLELLPLVVFDNIPVEEAAALWIENHRDEVQSWLQGKAMAVETDSEGFMLGRATAVFSSMIALTFVLMEFA